MPTPEAAARTNIDVALHTDWQLVPCQWLALIKDHVAASVRSERDDFEDLPFNQKGGLGWVHQVFAGNLDELLEELNEVLVS